MRLAFFLPLNILMSSLFGQAIVLHNAPNRLARSLAGNWHYIVDPYETGFRNQRNWTPFDEKKAAATTSAAPYYAHRKPAHRGNASNTTLTTRPHSRYPATGTANTPNSSDSGCARI